MLGTLQRASTEACFDGVEGPGQLLAASHLVRCRREEVTLLHGVFWQEIEGRDADEAHGGLGVEAPKKLPRRDMQRTRVASRRVKDPLTTAHTKVCMLQFDAQPPCTKPLVPQSLGDLVTERQQTPLELDDTVYVAVEGTLGPDTFVDSARLHGAVIEAVGETPEVPAERAEPSLEFLWRPSRDVLDARQPERSEARGRLWSDAPQALNGEWAEKAALAAGLDHGEPSWLVQV